MYGKEFNFMRWVVLIAITSCITVGTGIGFMLWAVGAWP